MLQNLTYLLKYMSNEFCIMPNKHFYYTYRMPGLERHEVFFGGRNRSKSIEDGLVVFITPEQHRGTYGVHGKKGHELDLELKQIAEERWCEFYGKTKEQFIKRYGRNYL